MISLQKYDDRIPNWNFTDLLSRACPFCGSINFKRKYLRPDNLTVVLCNRCETHFVSPGPSELMLDKFYKTYYGEHAVSLLNKGNLQKKILGANIYDDVRISKLSTLLNISGSRVLDVGCGDGEFLIKLKHLGAQIAGIDLSREAINAARNNGVERAFQIKFSDFFDAIQYDLIILNDVVEHPLDPLNLILKAKSLLRDGGLILIWTPNNDNIFLDSEKKTLRVDLEHMQYLGSKACKFISESYLLELVHYESLGYCTYSANHNKNLAKKILISLLKIVFLYQLIKKFYTLIRIKNNRRGRYHLFVVFKKSS